MIGDRIRQARLAAGLTLGALGDKVGVTHTAIQKYEKGTMTPPSSQLLKLARACGIRVEYFFRTHKVELLEPEFRKLATFGKAAQEALKIKVLDRIEKRVELLGFFPESPLLRFDSHIALPERVTGLDQLEGLADQVRDAWKLGLNPIGDLTDTLETRGLLARMLHKRCPVPPPGLDYAFFDFQAIVPPTPQAGRSVRSG
jgi:transcriptional regulator with XRE-family HTH domain